MITSEISKSGCAYVLEKKNSQPTKAKFQTYRFCFLVGIYISQQLLDEKYYDKAHHHT
jgi:hypothetical protein